MGISYTPEPQAPVQQPMPAPAPMPTQQQTIIPDPTTMDKTQRKSLRDYYRAQALANELIIVEGNASFAHIVTPIEGEELVKENARRSSQSQKKGPFYKFTLTDARVRFADPENPTAAELLAMTQLYTNKNNQVCYTAETSNADRMPFIGVRDNETEESYTQVYPKAEVANGTPAMVVLNTYANKNQGGTTSIGFQGVLIDDTNPVFGFAGGIARDIIKLQERGILFTPTSPDDIFIDPTSEDGQMLAAHSNQLDAAFAAPQQQPAIPTYQYQPTAPAAPMMPDYMAPAAPVTQFMPAGNQGLVN